MQGWRICKTPVSTVFAPGLSWPGDAFWIFKFPVSGYSDLGFPVNCIAASQLKGAGRHLRPSWPHLLSHQDLAPLPENSVPCRLPRERHPLNSFSRCFPGGKRIRLSRQETWVRSLVWEKESHVPGIN